MLSNRMTQNKVTTDKQQVIITSQQLFVNWFNYYSDVFLLKKFQVKNNKNKIMY